MRPLFPPEQSLNITDHICLTTNEFFKLRAEIATHELMFGTIMLVIGFVAGVIVWWSLPIAREYIRSL